MYLLGMVRRSRRVTQAEVARLAGVSQAMVSLVVNGSESVRVTPETRARIEEALRQTGYTVDVLGRRLRGRANRLIGVFTYESAFPSAQADFYVPFLGGIEEEAERQGYDLLMFTSSGKCDGRRHVYEEGSNRLGIADGCILLGRHTDREELARLLDEHFPFVFIGRRESPAGSVNYVGADYAAATAALYEELWGHGHRRIGMVSLASDSEATVDRRDGYRRACRLHHKAPIVINEGDPTESWARVRHEKLTGLLIETTTSAQAVHRLALADGVRVPDDLSIGVLGDADPTLGPTAAVIGEVAEGTDWSMFRIPRRQMGALAVRSLVELLEGAGSDDPVQVLLPCEVVPGSTIAFAPSRR